eukprot:COSAG06_NODE_1335_length_9833_cov_37.824205_9_plen_65_part_01
MQKEPLHVWKAMIIHMYGDETDFQLRVACAHSGYRAGYTLTLKASKAPIKRKWIELIEKHISAGP